MARALARVLATRSTTARLDARIVLIQIVERLHLRRSPTVETATQFATRGFYATSAPAFALSYFQVASNFFANL